ncbi:zinc finger, CCHC-type containing protein [Tanacetum coccineum]
MTTSVENNSVFRSFFEKQKLTGPNFIDWYRKLRLVLSTEDKENYLEHHIPTTHVAPPGQQVPPAAAAAHGEQRAQRNLAHLVPYDMLQELKAMFSKQAEQELLQTVREFHTCKQEEGQSVSSYVLKMKGYIDNLERLGQPVGQNLVVSLIFVSLNKDFDIFVQNYNMHGMGKTVNELHAMLKLHEDTLPKKDANPALHAIRAGRTPPPPKKDNPAKDAIYHQCGEIGHWRRNCPVYLAALMKKKKLSQGASTSGSTGKWSYLSRFVDDGFINHFDDNNVIPVSKNNLVYFMAVPRDGIFEIDMSCSNTNDSSISKSKWSEEDLELIYKKKIQNPSDPKTNAVPQNDVCIYVDAEEHELGDLNEPANYKVALLDLESKKWLDAMNNPGEEHWTVFKNILKYLRNTKDMFLVYGGNMERELRVSCYTDAGYLTDVDDLRS